MALTVFTIVVLPYLDFESVPSRGQDPLAYILVVLAGAGCLVRVRWPVIAVLICNAAVGTYLVLSFPYGPFFGFVVLSVYTVARHRSLRIAGAAGVAALVMLLAHVPVNEAALSGLAAVVPALGWVAIPFTIGAARRAVVAARLRERLADDQRLVDAERLRLSQDVHDVVGHGLAAIQMQADITLHVHAAEPARMRHCLEAISQASQDALEEVRATLDSIRSDDPDGRASRAPAPGLASAADLCRRVEEAGVRVDVTNQNLGPLPVEGIGISGMRRRVSQAGGTFYAGPARQHGTFQVRAVIPRTREELQR